MKTYTLTVIPPPRLGSRVLLQAEHPSKDFVFVRGTKPSGYRFECGNCRRALLIDVEKRRLSDFVVVCPACGSYNDALRAHRVLE